MDTPETTSDLAALYSASVDQEREAWHALHAHAPGTPERARAWETWSQAIVRTNHAWRRLNASCIGRALRQPAAAGARQHA